MLNLTGKNSTYFIISACNAEKNKQFNDEKTSQLQDDLYLLDYSLVPMDGYYQGIAEKSFFVYKNNSDNNELREDAIRLMNKYDQNEVIIKYSDEDIIKKIIEDGSEKTLQIQNFAADVENRSYIYGSMAFSLKEQKRYWYPEKETDFKSGYVVEMLGSSGNWITKRVENPNQEWNQMYKLLAKYKKVRIEY